MPELPSKPPAKGAAKAKPAAATTRRAPRRKANEGGNGATAKPAAAAAKTKAKPAANAQPEQDFEHRQVDEHSGAAAAAVQDRLTDDQRVLLGDLFAVVEEHAGEAVEPVDRDLV